MFSFFFFVFINNNHYANHIACTTSSDSNIFKGRARHLAEGGAVAARGRIAIGAAAEFVLLREPSLQSSAAKLTPRRLTLRQSSRTSQRGEEEGHAAAPQQGAAVPAAPQEGVAAP